MNVNNQRLNRRVRSTDKLQQTIMLDWTVTYPINILSYVLKSTAEVDWSDCDIFIWNISRHNTTTILATHTEWRKISGILYHEYIPFKNKFENFICNVRILILLCYIPIHACWNTIYKWNHPLSCFCYSSVGAKRLELFICVS